MIYFKKAVFCFVLFFSVTMLAAQKTKQANLVYADKQGVLRYTSTKAEASFFGVNYTTPFAHAYRAHKVLNVDLEQAIRNDVYHFSRLGLNAFRVHVWDNEISDTAGNLIENEHLRLFDFLLAELKKRNIKTIITPIAFWGNGYPERDEATPGFSRYFGRGKLTTNDTAIRAQENYLKQFFKHINPYTKLSYENDKDIIAVELNNEPSHSNPKKRVTDYINRLAAAVKSTGFTKPLFYNIAQGPYFSDAVAASVVDGFSFQWYPSGLVGNQTIKGNTLPNVDLYQIPFRDTVTAFKNKALMVYEFDAADVMDSYMYPAIAKSFRGAGFQWATQFAYDPMAIAYVNTEYQTHYLNLAYTPSKAISMMIAAEVFHRVPRMKNFGAYPADSVFDVFRVSYANALSEMNAADKFYYSNNTTTVPVNKKELKHIAGVGSSPVVQYEGTGAYFLDKISDGVWILEVMPDVIYVRDPFERASPNKEVTQIKWNKNRMKLFLDGLGGNLIVRAVNQGNNYTIQQGVNLEDGFDITPGKYIISHLLTDEKWSYNSEFVAPLSSKKEVVVRHEQFTEVSAGKSFLIKAIVGGVDSARVSVQLSKLGGGLFRNIPMKKNGYEYTAEIPADVVVTGQLPYRILVQEGNEFVTYPGAIKGNPFAWDNYSFETYKTNIAAAGSSLELYNPSTDRTVHVLPNFRRGFQTGYASGSSTGTLIHKFSITDIKEDEVMGLQHFIGNKLQQRSSELNSFTKIILRARTENKEPLNVKITLVSKNGFAFAAIVSLSNQFRDMEIPLVHFKNDKALLMPRPYPGFQPLYFQLSAVDEALNLKNIEKIEITVSPLIQQSNNKSYSLEIEKIVLQ
ncbi:MAG: cellulase family glycosylhydrolase [Chitinophagaceae bacterium]|nr:cellulase family glycosylhydrolase [Chitinophagaceae bacterium]